MRCNEKQDNSCRGKQNLLTKPSFTQSTTAQSITPTYFINPQVKLKVSERFTTLWGFLVIDHFNLQPLFCLRPFWDSSSFRLSDILSLNLFLAGKLPNHPLLAGGVLFAKQGVYREFGCKISLLIITSHMYT